MNKKSIRFTKNPLTRSESKNLLTEARVHSRIKGRPVKRAYYKGMSAGMRDSAEQYGRNPMDIGGGRENAYKGYFIEPYIVDRGKFAGNTRYAVRTSDWQTIKYVWSLAEGKSYIDSIVSPASNPACIKKGGLTEIYARILEIVAQKGPRHKCDAACRRAGHIYRHKFTRRSGVYGLPDGSIVIKNKP